MATDLSKKESLSELTERIVDSYHEIGSINHLGHCPLPSSTRSSRSSQDLKEILYPGYRRRQNLHLGNVTYYVGDLIDSLHDRLTQQIARACGTTTTAARADLRPDAAARLRGPRPGTRRSSSWNRCPSCGSCWPPTCRPPTTATRPPTSLDEIIFCYPGLEAITVHRLAHAAVSAAGAAHSRG